MRTLAALLLGAATFLPLVSCGGRGGLPPRPMDPGEGAGPSGQSSVAAHEQWQAGKRIYRDGILIAGRPLRARVAGDVAFEGTQFNCVSCHQRSGMGSLEGWEITPAVTRQGLYTALDIGPRKRPAYTDETLIRCLRTGIDPAGNTLDPLMPRYEFSDEDARALVAYLKTLSQTTSPGVTSEDLHVATVTTPDVDPTVLLQFLTLFIDHENIEHRLQSERRRHGPMFRDNINLPYRKWRLHHWPLEGSPETWRAQLERYYEEQPVFAFLSGMGGATWQPVHEFCEEREIPCLLPNTDLPVLSDDDWYTVYFSEGIALEAHAIAAHLRELPGIDHVVSLHEGSVAGRTGSRALAEALADDDALRHEERCVDPTAGWDPAEFVTEAPASSSTGDGGDADESGGTALVFWMRRADLERHLDRLQTLTAKAPPPRLYFSASLLGDEFERAPDALRRLGFAARPFALTDLFENRFRRMEVWFRGRDIPVSADTKRMLAQTYFTLMLFGDSLKRIRFDYFYRDYVLECVDHMTLMPAYSAAHPNPTFGPGQRYLSKGCYIVDGAHPENVRWYVP